MSNDLVEVKNYAIAQMDMENFTKTMRANLGGSQINESDLDRVGIPAGGSTTWRVPTLDGEEKTESITGVIVYWKSPRVYWATEYDGSNNPPDCYSDNGEMGIGEPGGDCNTCPMAQFGSADKGDGQACNQLRMLFILRKDDFLPIVVRLTPGSLKAIRMYFLRLASKGIPYYGVVTELSLEEVKSSGGIAYAQVAPKMVKRLSQKEQDRIEKYSETIKPSLTSVKVEDDFRGQE